MRSIKAILKKKVIEHKENYVKSHNLNNKLKSHNKRLELKEKNILSAIFTVFFIEI